MLLKKGKNYPKMISFLLSAENPEHALTGRCLGSHNHDGKLPSKTYRP
jgi:hypothetical protein